MKVKIVYRFWLTAWQQQADVSRQNAKEKNLVYQSIVSRSTWVLQWLCLFVLLFAECCRFLSAVSCSRILQPQGFEPATFRSLVHQLYPLSYSRPSLQWHVEWNLVKHRCYVCLKEMFHSLAYLLFRHRNPGQKWTYLSHKWWCTFIWALLLKVYDSVGSTKTCTGLQRTEPQRHITEIGKIQNVQGERYDR